MKYSHFREMLTENIDEAKIILGSASYDLSCSCGNGTSQAPKTLRELSRYLPCYDANFHYLAKAKIYDYTDVYPTSTKENFYSELEEQARKMFSYSKFVLFLGGDHSISIPLEKVFYQVYTKQNKHPVIIHLDAHMDILDEYMDSKMSHACPNRRAIENGYSPSDIHMIGIRSYEQGEVEYYEKHPELHVITADEFRKMGYQQVVDSIKKCHSEDAVYYLSFDIDILDPAYAPGTGTPESFGLTPLDLRNLLKELFSKLNIEAMDLVEISPKLDCNDITSWLGLKLLYEMIYQKFIKEEEK
jgi:agmatinase